MDTRVGMPPEIPNAWRKLTPLSKPAAKVTLSPSITAGTVVSKTSYNHYSSLASIEDLFGLPRLGEAATVATTFDKGIFAH